MGAWIEIYYCQCMHYMAVSHPTMGAWIEIIVDTEDKQPFLLVAPHDGCVD